MALRTFLSNPSLGGFGHSSGSGILSTCTPSSVSAGPASAAGRGPSPFPPPAASLPLPPRSGGGGGEDGEGEAFSRIVKELVDNAVDACRRGGGGGGEAPGPPLEEAEAKGEEEVRRRVRVVIELANGGDGDSDDDCDDDGPLRVSVNDNGAGMRSIGACVEAFRTSKRADAAGAGGGGGGGPGRSPGLDSGEAPTSGRYGIGLTLCLLHSQRLCPGSVASITSATTGCEHWTRASYVVDADSDRVRCVARELLPKPKSGGGGRESGTAVSLLVPGGREARAAWPRLAEYFARFHLGGVLCSLEVRAPTLSRVPLYVRPSQEFEQGHNVDLDQPTRSQVEGDEERRERWRAEDEEVSNCDDYDEETNDSQPDSIHARETKEDGQPEANAHNDDEGEWDDGLTLPGTDATIDRCYSNGERSGSSSSSSSSEDGCPSPLPLLNGSSRGEEEDRPTKDRNARRESPSCGKRELEEAQRRSIQRAAASYLNAPVELRNVAHSVQPIRCRDDTDGKLVFGSSMTANGERAMLQVDLIVLGPGSEKNPADDDISHDRYRADVDEEFGAALDDRLQEGTTSGDAANLSLIRMVNRVPLMDGAEASSCGLVRGIAAKKAMWNSFGLDILPRPEASSTRSGATEGTTHSYVPRYEIRDSAQVAPFFQQNQHALYESDDDERVGEEEDCYSDEYGQLLYSVSDRAHSGGRPKRVRGANKKILPADLRLGNVLVIVQIHANPSALPLPTLSKGRLPMNDAGIDDALEGGLSKCLRCLQRTNPELLLSANQLKRTERDVKYISAVAMSLASIISKSSNQSFKTTTSKDVLSWVENSSPTQEEGRWPAEGNGDSDVIEFGPLPMDDHTESNGESDEFKWSDTMTRDGDCTSFSNSSKGNPPSEKRLSRLIEDQLRYCISDENQARKKEEARERRLEARKAEKEEKERAFEESSSIDDSHVDLNDMLEDDEDRHEGETFQPSYQSSPQGCATKNRGLDSDTEFSEDLIFLPSKVRAVRYVKKVVTQGSTSDAGFGARDGFDEQSSSNDWW